MNRNNCVFLPVVLASVILFAKSNTASADGGVRLPAMPEMAFRIRWPLSSVVFTPSGRYLACGDLARGVYLWDLKSREKAWKVELPPVGAVSEEEVSLAFTGDGKALLLASYVRDPRVLDALSGKTLRILGREGEWFAPAVSTWCKDGREVAVTSSGGDLHFWNPSNGKEVMKLTGAGRKVVSLRVAKDAAKIALGLWALGPEDKLDDGRVLVRELPSGRIVFNERLSRFPIRQLAISPKGEHLVGASGTPLSGTLDEGLVCWSISRKKRLWSTKEVCGGLAISPDGKMLAYGSGSRIVLRDVHSGTMLSATRYGSHTISAVTFSSDRRCIAIGTDDGAVAVWRLLSGSNEKRAEQRSGKR